jgi:creatinine amidohydrolase/Fe(II)-dependent formamide hydrolase-like protein
MTVSIRRRAVLGALAAPWFVSFGSRAQAAPPTTPYIDELTWTELRDRLAAGATTVLVPIGGTEQSGPHMVLGKHNVRAHVLAGRIASKLGNALVAPVIAYVPEGSIDPPQAHMRFPGTISVSEATFEAVLESTAKSFRQHGFRDVVFLGDHGGYQTSLQRVASKLDREWSAGRKGAATPGCRVHALLDYYRVTQAAYVDALKARGIGADEIGTHAGLADTSLSLAIDPALVRSGALGREPKAGVREGVYGDPRRSSAELGQLGVDQIVAASVTAIRAMTGAR